MHQNNKMHLRKMSEEIKLPWMDIMRDMLEAAKTPKEIVDTLWEYGRSQEKRITEEVKIGRQTGKNAINLEGEE